MTQTEQTEKDRASCGSSHLFSRCGEMLPCGEKLQEAEQHFIRAGVEMLKGMRSLMDSCLSWMETCETEKNDRPERVSNIDITKEEKE